MFLRKLKLTNVRSIKDLEIDFSAPDDPQKIRQWTLLLAENGTGKSCVLRSIGLLLSGWDTLLKLMTDIDGWIRNGAKKARMEAVIETAQGEQRTIWLELERGMTTLEFSKRNEAGMTLLEAALRHTERNYFVVGYGASRRLPGSSLTASRSRQGSDWLPKRGQSMASLFSGDAELNSLTGWAMDLDYEKGKAGMEIIHSAIRTLLPGLRFDHIDKTKKQLLFKTPDGMVPLNRLSDGYQNMAGWIGDLLFRITQTFSDLKKPLEARGLLLLDEMDLHLHPVWQRQLMAFLTDRLPHLQIIATTHSPMTAQQAGPGELHLLERPNPKSPPVIRRFDGTPRHMRLEDLAVSPWFGLHTHYSLEVEKLRAEHEKEKRTEPKKKPTKKQAFSRNPASSTLSAINARSGLSPTTSKASNQLEALPVFEPRTVIEKQNFALLKKLDAVVSRMSVVSSAKPPVKKTASKRAAAKK